MIEQKELLKILEYNPATGIFTWKNPFGTKVKKGEKAGYVGRCGYRLIRICGSVYRARDLVFLYITGQMPVKKNQIEHINDNRDDISWNNLKIREKPEILTQRVLKEYLRYDPISGEFRWIKGSGTKTEINDIAGWSNSKGYLKIKLFGKNYSLHRLAFLYQDGSLPIDHVDHIDHNRSNNSWINLRNSTQQENSKNLKLSRKNTSGRVGVSWDKVSKKWMAKIRHENKCIYLGTFASFNNAVAAREKAEQEFGFHSNHGL